MKDSRLDLGRYITNPFNKRGDVTKRLDFDDLFTTKSETGEYPFNPSRFKSGGLTKKAMTQKLTQNPGLNYAPNTPFFDNNEQVTADYELFEGLGRFNRVMDYDFETGRPRTRQRPQNQPDFNPMWKEAYGMSPTITPGEEAKNPMPRLKNPDPKGYIMRKAEQRAESEVENKRSVAQLLAQQGSPSKAAIQQGEETEKIEQENT